MVQRMKKKTKKAWGTKDTVLVVGNQRDETLDSGKNMIWEYTPKTVKLVAAFRKKFPTFFSVISKNPEARKYDARSLGSKGIKELSLIREWLDNIETAKMPRTPYTTQEMPHTAISALQRAADVRDAAMEKENTSKQINLKIPAAALYLEGSTLPTDVLHHADGESPELGDRIVNLCANGLPFGLRGTIVGIHEESTGCVEVVMDKEFIGGSTLQGACSNFRGKLCVWNHLLKINPSNSKDIVEQMIPTGSGKATIDNMLKLSVEEDDKVKAKSIDKSMNNEKKNQVLGKPQETQNAWKQPSPLKTRVGKQGAWREAAGPSGNGIGFKGAGRGGKSGLHAWKKALASNGPTGAPKTDIPKPQKANSTEGLKAILGVKNVELKQNATDATAGLKNMLGIASSLPTVKPEAKGEQNSNAGPTSAADALMQLMVQAPSNIVHAPPPPPQQSSFNFTYVSEGDKKSPSSGGQSIAHPPVLYPNGPNVVYHSPMTHPMHYPTMIGQSMMMPPQPHTMNGPVVNESTLPKKEHIAVKEAPLIPSVTVKAKK